MMRYSMEHISTTPRVEIYLNFSRPCRVHLGELGYTLVTRLIQTDLMPLIIFISISSSVIICSNLGLFT